MPRQRYQGGLKVNGNGKRIAVLCALLVVGGTWAGLASHYTAQAEPVQPQAADDAKSFLNDSDSTSFTGVGLDNGDLFLRMMLAVGVVAGLGVGALYLSRKVLPRMVNTAGREIRIVETTCLGPRKALHLVEVGHQRLLIASTADRITMLTPVGETWLDIPRQQIDDKVEL
jgi:flagellar biogenesis protein FliO